MPSLNVIESNLKGYLAANCDGEKFEFNRRSDGLFGFGKTREFIDVYHVPSGEKSEKTRVAQVGYTTKAQSSLVKAGEMFSEVYQANGDPTIPAFPADRNKPQEKRIFTESKLVKAAQGSN